MRKLTLFVLVVASVPPAYADSERDTLATLVKNSCVKCHSGKRAEAEIDLDALTRGPIREADFKTWRAVARALSTNEMPPKGAKELSQGDRDRAVAIVRKSLDRIARSRAGDPGAAVRGRLSHAEYDNAIRDLTGLSLNISETFPADGSGGEGFANVGGLLTVASPGAFEKYLIAARRVADHVAFTPKGELRFVKFQEKGKGGSPQPEAVERDLLDFARRAWRRPLAEGEKAALVKHLKQVADAGEPLHGAVRVSLIRILCSPNFLFKSERSAPGKGTFPISQHELASRLSFFLWSSIPDAELSRLADDGKLEGDVVAAQVARMLADPKSVALSVEFFGQWLGFKGFDRHSGTDLKKFPAFTTLLRQEMYLETVEFFRDLIQADRPVPEILFSNATFLSDRLANHYQIDAATIDWPKEAVYLDLKRTKALKGDTRTVHPVYRVSLGKHSRGGLLGMASILTATSTPVRTAPSIRGKWIYESILGRDIPDPPADVGMIPDDSPKSANIRERLEKHRSQASCASCHARFDPLGFSLEAFDAIGRPRSKDATGKAIDDSADLGDASFRGIDGLREYLRKHQDEFLRNFSRKLVGFALGRSIAPADLSLLDSMVDEAAKNDQRFSSFVQTLTRSPAFRQRRAADYVDLLDKE